MNIIEILEYILLICFAKKVICIIILGKKIKNVKDKKIASSMLENVRSFCVVVYVVTDLNSADVDFRLFSFNFFPITNNFNYNLLLSSSNYPIPRIWRHNISK